METCIRIQTSSGHITREQADTVVNAVKQGVEVELMGQNVLNYIVLLHGTSGRMEMMTSNTLDGVKIRSLDVESVRVQDGKLFLTRDFASVRIWGEEKGE